MAEDLVVRFCAPTLAGIKTGSLFVCPFEDEERLRSWLRRMNRLLRSKGLTILSLRYRNGRALIDLYRASQLRRDLSDQEAASILHSCGYRPAGAEALLLELKHRILYSETFPHEIGLFLGYPPEDVRGFIRDCSACKCTGCWKVYGDVDEAQALFARYKTCTRVYCELFSRGRSIEQLAVAG